MEEDCESLFYFGNLNYTPEQSQQFNNYNHHNDSNIDMTEQNHDPLPFVNNDEDPFLKDIIFDFDEKGHKSKASAKTNQILDKLNKFEDTYYNNITSLPNTDVQLHDKQILIKNVHLIQNTLPGLIISFLLKNNNIPMPENVLYGIAFKQYNDLRKPNGSKYKGNINKVFKSTLSSSGLFLKISDGRWVYKEKEAIDYVLRVTEKVLTKKIDAEKKSAVMAADDTRSTNTEKKQTKKVRKKLDDVNFKIFKVYGILDDLLNKYKTDKEFESTLKNPFKNINSSIELLQKIGNDNQCVGILMCFKFFKSIIGKFIKFSCKQAKSEELLNTNAISDRLDLLNNKIDYIEKYFFAEKKGKKKI